MNKCYKYFTMCFLLMFMGLSTVFASPIVATPKQVVISTNGIFVEIDEILVAVDSISMANDGYIVATRIPKLDICPNCGHDTYTKGRFCRLCFFPNDW